jgi:DNA-binding transcriptional LysR family regulator
MPYFLTDFLRLHNGIELEMDVTNKNKVVKSLQNNEVDFALVSILPDKMNVEKIDLMQNKLFFVGNNEVEISSKKKDLDTIFNERPLIFRENGSGTRQAMERFIEKNAIKIDKKMELTSNEAVKQAILAGLGYSIMPLIGIRKEIQNKDLQIIPVPGLPMKTNWSLIWIKGKKHSPQALAYLEYLRKEKDEVIKKQFSWYETV